MQLVGEVAEWFNAHAWKDDARSPLPEATLAKPWHYEVERQGLRLLFAAAAVTHSMIGV